MYVPYLYMPKTKLKNTDHIFDELRGCAAGLLAHAGEAAIIVVLIPTVVLYLIFHKQITEGLSAGATKRNKRRY